MCGCAHISSTPHNAADFCDTLYVPTHATGFKIYSLPGDSSQIMLETYRPDTMQTIIPHGGFNSLLCMSTTHIGLLAEIGRDSLIVAVSNKDYVTNPRVKTKAAEAGYEGAMDYETILSVKPDVALIYGIGGANPIAGKLEEIGIPTIYIGDFEEQDPLGRAEWMVALGALTGTDARARLAEVISGYTPVADSVPVMINAPYGGNWFIPGKGNYMSQLIADAGGILTVPQPTGTESKPVDIEQALLSLAQADVWLNPGQVKTRTELKNAVPHATFTGKVWVQTPDFYESGAARPDLVLDELRQILSNRADSLRYFSEVK